MTKCVDGPSDYVANLRLSKEEFLKIVDIIIFLFMKLIKISYELSNV